MLLDLASLRASVQGNCHISDARHARDHTMCIYLLKMREYFRWEHGYPFNAPLPKDELGQWLTRRETLWAELEDAPFAPIRLGRRSFDPFGSRALNAELAGEGLVYSGGYGGYGAPHFFLADLVWTEQRDGLSVFVAGHEHARDLSAPPAMLQDDALFVRRDAVRRMVWEKIEEWRWKERRDAMARAMEHYGFDLDFDAALERMTDNEVEAALLHELGEWQAEAYLGEAWHDLLRAVSGGRGEAVARAVRDHLADSLSTLPALLERENDASLHFYFANLKGMRRELNPELVAAYRESVAQQDWQPVRAVSLGAVARWLEEARTLLRVCREEGERCAERVGALYACPAKAGGGRLPGLPASP